MPIDRLKIKRRDLFAKLGGTAAVAAMTHAARADALEHLLMMSAVDGSAVTDPAHGAAPKKYPTQAELATEVATLPTRRGAGTLFAPGPFQPGNVKILEPMPEKPTLVDFFQRRFLISANHCFQSANHAMKTGMPEEIVFACLLHDTVQELIRVDHGWWGAQLYEPYVSPRVAFALRYHQALRFYEDKDYGYEYPDLYRQLFGIDYVPDPYVQQTWKRVRKHKWYDAPRLVTVNDLYAFDPNVSPKLDQFVDVIGRNFKQPKEGLGFDNSHVAHMWRTIAMPDRPL